MDKPKRIFKTKPGPPPGPQPYKWISGPDPERHLRYRQWAQQKNQAQWRGERWNLSFEQWLEIWGDDIQNRGRGPEDFCLTRKNPDRSWTAKNVHILTRREHYQNNQQMSINTRKINKGQIQ